MGKGAERIHWRDGDIFWDREGEMGGSDPDKLSHFTGNLTRFQARDTESFY